MIKKKKLALLIAAAILVPVLSVSAEYDINTETRISWITGDISISATVPVPLETVNLTSERFRITETIDRKLTFIVTEAFSGIYLDSLQSLKDGFTSNSRMMTEFDTLNLSKVRISSSLSLDLDHVTNIYNYNIYKELIPILIEYEHPAPLPVVMEYEPTASFSGIVIYAADNLPYYGEEKSGTLNPAVFPKIFNDEMELVASPFMADPEWLKKWGFVLYTSSLDEKQFEQRLGLYPFRTTARAVFGKNHTDIIIPDDAARKILYNEANHRLVREGRIIVIVNSSVTKE